MEALRLTMLFLHILGAAAIIGGFLTQFRQPSPRVLPVMVIGAGLQVLTGLLLIFSKEMMDEPTNRPKLITKFIIALVVAGTARVGSRRPERVALFWATGLLAIVNVGVAVFW